MGLAGDEPIESGHMLVTDKGRAKGDKPPGPRRRYEE